MYFNKPYLKDAARAKDGGHSILVWKRGGLYFYHIYECYKIRFDGKKAVICRKWVFVRVACFSLRDLLGLSKEAFC